MAFSFLYSIQFHSKLSIFRSNTIGDANSICVRFIAFMQRLFSISTFGNSRTFGPMWYRMQLISRTRAPASSMWCLVISIAPKRPSHIFKNRQACPKFLIIFAVLCHSFDAVLQICIQLIITDSLNVSVSVHLVFSVFFPLHFTTAKLSVTDLSFSSLPSSGAKEWVQFGPSAQLILVGRIWRRLRIFREICNVSFRAYVLQGICSSWER